MASASDVVDRRTVAGVVGWRDLMCILWSLCIPLAELENIVSPGGVVQARRNMTNTDDQETVTIGVTAKLTLARKEVEEHFKVTMKI